MAYPDVIRFDEAHQRILAKGYTPDQFDVSGWVLETECVGW